MAAQPIAVTGIGMMCPLGIGLEACWSSFLSGESGVKRITRFDPDGCETQIGGQLPEDYQRVEKERIPKRVSKQTIRATRLIRLCSDDAVRDAGLRPGDLDPHRAGVFVGTSGGSVRAPDDIGSADTARFKIIREMVNASAAWISIENGFKGPSFTLSAGVSSGAYAIAQAVDLIRWGTLDAAIAGGMDVLLTKNSLRKGNALGVLSKRNDAPEKAMRPFDRDRDGWVLSDGGCALFLESQAHAMKRNARVYAYIYGHSALFRPFHPLRPVEFTQVIAGTMEAAIADAGVGPDAIDVIHANGNSAVMDDLCEIEALKHVFGKGIDGIPVTANKSMIGQTVGASGAITVALTALSLREQIITPTINFDNPDPACNLNIISNRASSLTNAEFGLCNSFGIGGHQSSMVLGRSCVA